MQSPIRTHSNGRSFHSVSTAPRLTGVCVPCPGRARYNLKTKKVKTKKSSAKPLPIDILERVPDSIEIRQKRRLAPQAVSQMALEKARATVADAEA
eukprot:m.88112 g.88112  ORF g.88112 m.88112 type:complete len:96 (+) comp16429_c0_seq4:70-357(+)